MTGIVHLGPRLSVNYSPLSPIDPLCPPLQNPNPFSDFPEPNVHLIKARLNPLPSIQNNCDVIMCNNIPPLLCLFFLYLLNWVMRTYIIYSCNSTYFLSENKSLRFQPCALMLCAWVSKDLLTSRTFMNQFSVPWVSGAPQHQRIKILISIIILKISVSMKYNKQPQKNLLRQEIVYIEA